jgi:hypothetical protein
MNSYLQITKQEEIIIRRFGINVAEYDADHW